MRESSSRNSPASAARVNALIQRAGVLQQSGRLTEAAAQYRALLTLLPDHPQILATLGTIALQQGDPREGVRWLGRSLRVAPDQPVALTNHAVGLYLLGQLQEAIAGLDRAIALKPDYADAHSNRGNALKALGHLEEALASYRHALACRPDYAEAHNNLGAALQDLGRWDEALCSFDRAIELKPGYADAWSNRGNALTALKRTQEALASLERAIALAPGHPQACNNLGAVLLELERFEPALEACDRALLLKSDYAQAHCNRGVALDRLGRRAEALESYDRAIACDPGHAEAHANRSAVLHELGRLSEALAACDRAIALKPGYVSAHSTRGVVLEELKRFDDAALAYDRALALQPDHAQARNNRGGLMQRLGLLDQALQEYDRAIALKPDYVEAHTNRGAVLQEMRRSDEALASYQQALALRPEHAPAHMGGAFIKLLAGDYQTGWTLYEWRWKDRLKDHARCFEQPQWTGEQPLEGRTLLIHAEQGYGDFIQCCRYAPLAAKRGARVVLEAPAALVALAGSLDGAFQVFEKGAPLPAFDLHCPAMSLPLAFGTTVATVPSRVPYLHASAERRLEWASRLAPRTRPRVGLAWSGAIGHKNDHNRSIRLRELEPLLQHPLEFHAVQNDIRPEDAGWLAHSGIAQHGHRLTDFAQTAALIEQMDLVICVDTSIAHLAGALGKPVWILLPFLPDWRWMLDRDDSPWYPTARLFRQSQRGDWAGAIGAVSEGLRSIY